MNRNHALVGQINQAVEDLGTVDQRVAQLLTQAKQSNDRAYLEAAALYLHTFYAGLEQIFSEIAREIDNALPSHEAWHVALLRQMAAEIPQTRPAVLRKSSQICLDEYRAFRHVVRNVYTFHLNPQRIAELAAGVPACYQAVQQDLSRFCEFLLANDG
jgi:hypothetical protein